MKLQIIIITVISLIIATTVLLYFFQLTTSPGTDQSNNIENTLESETASPFLDKSIEEVTVLANSEGKKIQVVEIDDVPQPTSKQATNDTINVYVEDGIVVDYESAVVVDDELGIEFNDVDNEQFADYVGLSFENARAQAEAAGTSVQIIEDNGRKAQLDTSYVPGRVNIYLTNNVITDYFIENPQENYFTLDEAIQNLYGEVIGMTVSEAEAFASSNNIPFRTINFGEQINNEDSELDLERITVLHEDGVVIDFIQG